MMTSVDHSDIERRTLVERYVAGRLAGTELDEFERHLIGCADCQQFVQLGSAIRAEVSALPAPAGWRGRWSHRWVWTGVAAAAVFLGFAGMRASNQEAIKGLGRIDAAPAYAGFAVRATENVADSIFERGMRFYMEGRMDSARTVLIDARTRGADSVPTSFFIGVADLMTGRPRLAIDHLTVVVRRPDTPYTDEAHYYLAKAWLQLGRADSARVHLALPAAGSAISAAARALSDSIAGRRR